MPDYLVTAKVDQIVTKEVQLVITASDPDKAEERAREALQEYPAPVTGEGVKRILTVKSTFWIPKSIDFPKKPKLEKRK